MCPSPVNSAKNSSWKSSFFRDIILPKEKGNIFNPEQNLFKVYVLKKPFTENWKYNLVKNSLTNISDFSLNAVYRLKANRVKGNHLLQPNSYKKNALLLCFLKKAWWIYINLGESWGMIKGRKIPVQLTFHRTLRMFISLETGHDPR